MILGPPGIGKSAFAAHLVRTRPSFISAYHFCAASRATWTDPTLFTRSLVTQLATRYPAFYTALLDCEGHTVTATQIITSNVGTAIALIIERLGLTEPEDEFIRLILNPLAQLKRPHTSEPIVILVDSLNESLAYSGRATIARLLSRAADLPGYVRLLLTTRDERSVMRYWERVPIVTIDAASTENLDDVRRYIHARLRNEDHSDSIGALSTDYLADMIASKSSGNFVYAVHLMNAVERNPTYLSVLEDLPEGLDGVYRAFLTEGRTATSFPIYDTYRPVFATLAVAREPPTESQLLQYTGMTVEDVSSSIRDLWEYLFVDLGPPRTFSFFHESFREFLLDQEKSGDYFIHAATWHERIAQSYYNNCRFDDALSYGTIDPYAIHHLAHHLAQAVRTKPLFCLITDTEWRACHLRSDPLGRTFLADLDTAISVSARRDLGIARIVTYSLLYSVLAEPMTAHAADFVMVLLELNEINPAIELSAVIASPELQSTAFTEIGRRLSMAGHRTEGRAWLDRSVGLVEAIGDPQQIAHCITTLVPALMNLGLHDLGRHVIRRASQAAVALDDPLQRVFLRTEIARTLLKADLRRDAAAFLDGALDDVSIMPIRFVPQPLDHETSYLGIIGLSERLGALEGLAGVIVGMGDRRSGSILFKKLSAIGEQTKHVALSSVSTREHREVGSRLDAFGRLIAFLTARQTDLTAGSGPEPVTTITEEIVRARDFVMQFRHKEALGILRRWSRPAMPVSDVLRNVLALADGEHRESFARYLILQPPGDRLDGSYMPLVAAAAVAFLDLHESALATRIITVVIENGGPEPGPNELSCLLDCVTVLSASGLSPVNRLLARCEDLIAELRDEAFRFKAATRLSMSWARLGQQERAIGVLMETGAARALSVLPGGLSRDRILRLFNATAVAPSDRADQGSFVYPPRHLLNFSCLDVSSGARARTAVLAVGSRRFSEAIDAIRGLPRNDDLGTMLSWLCFQISGQAVEDVDLVAETFGRIRAATTEMWSTRDVSRVRAAIVVSLLTGGSVRDAITELQEISDNDYRVAVLGIIVSYLGSYPEKARGGEDLDRLLCVVNGLWSDVDVVKGEILLAAFSEANERTTAVGEALQRARARAVSPPPVRSVSGTIEIFPRFMFSDVVREDVESALAFLTLRGYGTDVVPLVSYLREWLEVPKALQRIATAALLAGDGRTYEFCYYFAAERGLRPGCLMAGLSTSSNQADVSRAIVTALRSVKGLGLQVLLEHLEYLAPAIVRVDPGFVTECAECLDEIQPVWPLIGAR